jgi:hypothetical protein
MALSNYGELKTSLADWLARDDLTNQIPDFISLFEAHARRDYGGTVLASKSLLTTTANQPTLALGVTPRSITYLGHDDGEDMRQGGIEEINRMGTLSAKPTLWAWETGTQTVRLFPVPDAVYDLVFYYSSSLTGLTGDSSTNWLLTNYPDIYLYGALLQARQYLQDEALQVYEQKFQMLDESLKQALSRQTNSVGKGTCWSRGAPV